MTVPYWLALGLLCLLLAACAGGSTDNSDNGQRHGFYGGVSTGSTMGP